MILASVQAVATIAGAPFPGALALARVAAGSADLSVTIDPAPLLAALPARSTGRRQIVGFILRIDGVEVPRSRWAGDCDVTLALAPLQRWTLSGPLPGPFGSARTYLGAAPGGRRIDISGLYVTPSGPFEIPLVTNGIVDSETREQRPDGTLVVTITGADASARYDHRLVDYTEAPGQGLARAAVVREILRLAGAASADIRLIGTVNHEVQIVKQEPFSAAQPIAEVEGHGLGSDRYGNLRSAVAGYDPGRRVALVLSDRDILRGASRGEVPGDLYTRLVLTGSQTVLSAGQRTTTQVDLGYSLYAPKQAAFVQNSDGSLSSLSPAAIVPGLILTSMVKTVSGYAGDTLLWQEVTTWAYWNQEVARYVLHADGTVEWLSGGLYGNIYLYAGAAANDNSPAYHLAREQFLIVGRQRTVYTYDARHYLVRTETQKDMPFLRLAAVQQRSSVSTSWESAGFILGRLLTGNRAGVDNGGATPGLEALPDQTSGGVFGVLVPREISTVEETVTDDGYVTRRVTTTTAYAAPDGALYRYADGKDRSTLDEILTETVRAEISYSSSGADAGHLETTLTYQNGALVSQDGPNLRDGFLPAATKDLSADPAARQKGQPFELEEIDYVREGIRPRCESVVSNPWIETPEEAQAFLRRMLREDAGIAVTVQTPVNFLVDPDWLVRLDLKTFDLLGDGTPQPIDLHNLIVNHVSPGPDGPHLTTITGRCYLELGP